LRLPAFFPQKNNCSTFAHSFQWVCGLFLAGWEAAMSNREEEFFGYPDDVLSGDYLSGDGAVDAGTSPGVYHTAELEESCRIIEAAAVAAEHYYPLVLTGSQMKLVERAVSLACDDAIEAMRGEPEDCHHEIEPDIDAYNLISAALKLARSSRKGVVGDHWSGDAL
jgi:hypothetical protein